MYNNVLAAKRQKDLTDALSFKEPAKVPVGVEVLYWPLTYAGVKYSETCGDPQKTADAYMKFLDVIGIDCYWGGLITRPVKAYEALGCHKYGFSADGNTIVHLQPNIEFMSADDYPEFIEDPAGFQSRFLERSCEILRLPRAEAYEKVKEAILEFRRFTQTNDLIRGGMASRGIIPLVSGNINYISPLSTIFDRFRGMRDTLADLRRRPELLRRACASLFKQMKEDVEKLGVEGNCDPNALGHMVYHSECFISPAQFDEFFFEPLMELYMPFLEAGAKIQLKGEGSFINTIDRYRKLPKGSVLIMLDEDDPFEMYKEIGDWQPLATGITADLLKLGTKDQCVDYVKKCFDTFAPGGGFVFFPNKPLLCEGDVKIENLIAVYETANRLSEG